LLPPGPETINTLLLFFIFYWVLTEEERQNSVQRSTVGLIHYGTFSSWGYFSFSGLGSAGRAVQFIV